MQPFGFLTAGRIAFGRGTAAQAVAQTLLRGQRVLVVRGNSVAFADTAIAELMAAGAGVLPVRTAGEPDLAQLDACILAGRAHRADVVLAIGGGSAIDLGKAAAALIPAAHPPLTYLEVVGEGRALDTHPLPFIAVPTTSGTGAEVTKNAVIGVPAHGRKVSLRDDRMLADLAIIDPALSDGCPRDVTLASGLDAVTQVIEPYLSARANPLTDALCHDAIPRGLGALAALMQGEDPAARDDLAFTSLIGGIALANAGLGAVHGLAGVIGGRTGAPHGAVCGRLLAPVLRANRDAMQHHGADLRRFQDIETWIKVALGGTNGCAFDLLDAQIDAWGLPYLTELGVAPAARAALATEAQRASSMAANCLPLSEETLTRIMTQAR